MGKKGEVSLLHPETVVRAQEAISRSVDRTDYEADWNAAYRELQAAREDYVRRNGITFFNDGYDQVLTPEDLRAAAQGLRES